MDFWILGRSRYDGRTDLEILSASRNSHGESDTAQNNSGRAKCRCCLRTARSGTGSGSRLVVQRKTFRKITGIGLVLVVRESFAVHSFWTTGTS